MFISIVTRANTLVKDTFHCQNCFGSVKCYIHGVVMSCMWKCNSFWIEENTRSRLWTGIFIHFKENEHLTLHNKVKEEAPGACWSSIGGVSQYVGHRKVWEFTRISQFENKFSVSIGWTDEQSSPRHLHGYVLAVDIRHAGIGATLSTRHLCPPWVAEVCSNQ